jgi:chromatin remodeling complex protein RSC6
MVKKAQTITSQPIPVQEVRKDEIEKVKQVETIKTIETVPKKTKKVKKVKEVTEPVVTEPVVTEPVVEEPVVTEPVVEEPVVEELDENVEELDENVALDVKKRNRRVVNKANFYDDFESFIEQLNTFFEQIKNEKGIKNAKNAISKKAKQLQNDSYKLLKIKNLHADKKPKLENNSGFMKPIKISEDLANFLETNPEEPITRVHVTKKLCQYIKEKDLQNPEDRREIIPDDKLKSLFKLGSEKLTYYSMQKQIQQHIFKI